jgi:hypothetical protein
VTTHEPVPAVSQCLLAPDVAAKEEYLPTGGVAKTQALQNSAQPSQGHGLDIPQERCKLPSRHVKDQSHLITPVWIDYSPCPDGTVCEICPRKPTNLAFSGLDDGRPQRSSGGDDVNVRVRAEMGDGSTFSDPLRSAEQSKLIRS